MEGTPPLLTNIQFGEAKKGYDRDQVDTFLRELSVKVGELQNMLRDTAQRAETAEAQLAEATKAKQLAEEAAVEAKAEAASARAELAAKPEPAPAPEPVGVSDVDAASGILALAQKTAEAAIEEADKKAKDLIADARAKAAMIVVEVEADVERIRNEATAEGAAVVADRTAFAEAEVQRLTARRTALQADAELLEQYLEDHRRHLREGVASLEQLLAQAESMPPAPVVGGDAPPASSSSDDDTPDGPGDGGGPGGGAKPAPVEDSIDVGATDAQARAATGGVPGGEANVTRVEPAPVSTLADTAAPGDAVVPSMLFGDFEAPDASFRHQDETDEVEAVGPTIVTVEDLQGTERPAAPPLEVAPGDAAPAVATPVEPTPAHAPAVEDAAPERPGTQVAALLEAPVRSAPAPVAATDPIAAPAPAAAPAATPAVAAVPVVPIVDEPAAAPAPEPTPEPAPEPVVAAPAVAAVPAAPPAPEPDPEPAEAEPVVVAATGTEGATVTPILRAVPNPAPSAAAPATATPATATAAAAERPTIDLTTPSLFGTDEPTQAYDVLGASSPGLAGAADDGPSLVLDRSPDLAVDDSSPLGEPDAQADAAMRAFFDQDPEAAARSKGRFLRRK